MRILFVFVLFFFDEKMFDLDSMKMIVCGPLIEKKQIGEVKKTTTKVSTRSYGMIRRMFRERCVACSI